MLIEGTDGGLGGMAKEKIDGKTTESEIVQNTLSLLLLSRGLRTQ